MKLWNTLYNLELNDFPDVRATKLQIKETKLKTSHNDAIFF